MAATFLNCSKFLVRRSKTTDREKSQPIREVTRSQVSFLSSVDKFLNCLVCSSHGACSHSTASEAVSKSDPGFSVKLCHAHASMPVRPERIAESTRRGSVTTQAEYS